MSATLLRAVSKGNGRPWAEQPLRNLDSESPSAAALNTLLEGMAVGDCIAAALRGLQALTNNTADGAAAAATSGCSAEGAARNLLLLAPLLLNLTQSDVPAERWLPGVGACLPTFNS